MRISAPIKHFWSENHSLDFTKMLSASDYKEKHRLGMVQWSMEVRAENYGYFCYEAIRMADGNKQFQQFSYTFCQFSNFSRSTP
jgi:phosphomevalonate kinase